VAEEDVAPGMGGKTAAQYRRVFVILVRDGTVLEYLTTSSFGSVKVEELVNQIHVLSTAGEDESEVDERDEDEPDTSQGVQDVDEVAIGFAIREDDQVVLLDWYLNELPRGVLLVEVPQPGIVVAIVNSADRIQSDDEVTELAMQLRLYAEKSDTKIGDRIRRFMVSPDVGFVPAPLRRYDVFLSHDVADYTDVLALQRALAARGLTCFVAAKNIAVGTMWETALLDALTSSRVGLVLLTEQSAQSSWVMCEVGAMWGASLPIVTVLKDVVLRDLPDAMSSFQWYSTSTFDDLGPLVDSVERLCRQVRKEVV
jgi:hypothetical protein